MLTFTATEAKQQFGTVTDKALSNPVQITRRGRVVLELMTPEDKERMFQKRLNEIAERQFLDDAIESKRHYERTGLHVTLDELREWSDSLSTPTPKEFPKCHK